MSTEVQRTFERLWIDLRSRWCDCRDLEGALAFSHDDVPSEFFHRVVAIDVAADEVNRLIDDALTYFRAKDFACAFTISPQDRPVDLAAHLLRRGFVQGKQASAMSFESASDSPGRNESVTLHDVAPNDYDTWADVMRRSFESPIGMGEVGRTVLAAPDTKLYLAQVDGEPAGSALLHSQFGMGYVDLVGTLPAFRGQGVATALVRQAVADSLEQGNCWTALEAVTGSPAERIYERIGFRVKYHRERFTVTFP